MNDNLWWPFKGSVEPREKISTLAAFIAEFIGSPDTAFLFASTSEAGKITAKSMQGKGVSSAHVIDLYEACRSFLLTPNANSAIEKLITDRVNELDDYAVVAITERDDHKPTPENARKLLIESGVQGLLADIESLTDLRSSMRYIVVADVGQLKQAKERVLSKTDPIAELDAEISHHLHLTGINPNTNLN